MKSRLAGSAFLVFAAVVACDGSFGTGSSPSTRDISAYLTGAAMRPIAISTRATGVVDIRVTPGTSDVNNPNDGNLATFSYWITVSQLSSPATEACIHGPGGADAVTNELAFLTVTSQQTDGLIISGTLTRTINPLVSGDSLLVLLMNGNAYVDVHTVAHPKGELRGQTYLLNGALSRR